MTKSQPVVTGTTHTLPFEKLDSLDFERLCLWLVERAGYEQAEHLGAAGGEQGRDIIAWRQGELWAFQCKRVQRFGPKDALAEVDKVLALSEDLRPVGLVFIVTCNISANTRERVRERCTGKMECRFWASTELDARVKQHPDVVKEFFQAAPDFQAKEVADYLARAMAAYEAQMYQLAARPAALPDRPYKFLYAFETEDAGIFFGRDAASQALFQSTLEDRLCVLHAKSGAGKTSLLKAGLLPRLIPEGRLPVYVRVYDDPVLAIKRVIAPLSLGPWPGLLAQLTLHEFLSLACAYLGQHTQELVVILDQFEEFFIFLPELHLRQSFIDALADCYNDKSLALRFIISTRGDYFTHLATFQQRLPQVFHNEYYVKAMSCQEAQAAITGPVAKLDPPVTCEQALLDVLLDDLARGGMELPHLQIICTRLYEELPECKTTITLASYEKLGRAEGVLGSYLNSVLDKLPGSGGSVAREVLKELVSSKATKRVLNYGALAARVGTEESRLNDVLTWLVDAHLLRRDEVEGEVMYEIAHEYLIEEIEVWIDQADLAFKQAEELLEREMANWHVHGTLIPRNRLEMLYTHREHFRSLGDDVWELILRSSMQANFALENWAQLAGAEIYRRVLIPAIVDQQPPVKRAQVGGVLAVLGVSRPGVGVDSITNLPDIAWCEIPAGAFVMGSAGDDGMANSNERPQYRNETVVESYWIGRYPITNSQFATFLDSGGYQEREYWTAAGWERKEREGWAEPQGYQERASLLHRPVVGVSWYEVVAFCRWLTERLREQGKLGIDEEIALPTESQWEKAARGTDGRAFPWGEEADPDRANYDQTGIDTASTVGCFPNGASPYGVEDLSGNVWEWCQTKWQESYDNYLDDKDLTGSERRVLRGGSFYSGRRGIRCANRFRYDPDCRFDDVGFRVVMTFPKTS